VPAAEPRSGHVVVAVKAFGLNYAEIDFRQGVSGDVARVTEDVGTGDRRPNETTGRLPWTSRSRQAHTQTMKKRVWRAVTEAGFIIFLFYSNLLMGEFERSGMGRQRGLAWALGDILTVANFGIAAIAALIGYGLVEFLRNRL
jgi:hypothetical protein